MRFLYHAPVPDTPARIELVGVTKSYPSPDGAEVSVLAGIDLTVFGKLASIGFSVIKGKARQMADDFAAGIRGRLEAAPQGGRS